MSVHDNSFAVYWATDDAVIECTACDPDAGEPEGWPSWCDEYLWTPTAAPSEQDSRWAAEHVALPPVDDDQVEPFEPSPQDWDDFARWSGTITDSDIQNAGLPVG